MRQPAAVVLAATSLAASIPFVAARAADDAQQRLVESSAAAVEAMRASTGFDRSGLLARAEGALIVPHAVRGAVLIGGQGGGAVLLRNNGGRWSHPAFYTVGGVSLGLQVGGEETTSVLLIMTERAFRTLLQPSNATGGVQGTLTAARYGANGIAQLGGADIVIWSTSQGAFAGVNLNVTGFQQDADAERIYYGRPIGARAIFAGSVRNGADRSLRRAL